MDLPSKTYLDQVRKSSPRSVGRDCEEWFNTFYDEQTAQPPESLAGPIEAGKIYTWVYDPKFANDLPFYDTFPIFLSMGHLQNGNVFGINLSYIPPRVKLRVLDKFVRVFQTRFIKPNVQLLSKGKVGQMREIPFFYDVAKHMLAGSNFENAIRSYLYSHVYTPPRVITYEDYWRILAFTSDGIKKLNIRAIYSLYKKVPIGHPDKKIEMEKNVRPTQQHIKNRQNR